MPLHRSIIAVLVLAVGASACIIDDDPYVPTDAAEGGAIVLSQMFLQVPEGQSQTLGVTLAAVPARDVVVSVGNTGVGLIDVIPQSFEFTADTFAIPQNVTIAGLQDQDVQGNSASVIFTASAYPNVTAMITVVDDDVQQIVTSPTTTVNVTEGMMVNAFVKLAYQPSANVIVSVIANGGECTVLPPTLTFTPSDYSTDRDLFIHGETDADTTDDACPITLMAAGLAPATIPVTVVDVN